MNRANNIKLGAFVLVSLTLLIGGFAAVGIAKIFEPKVEAVTILNTSVEGLSVGSPVKYLGLPIGKVTRIAMRENDGYIAVYFDLTTSAMDSVYANNHFGSAATLVEVLKKHNPTCFINAAGLMGGCFLELTLGGQGALALPHLDNVPADYFYIPARPSHIGNAIQNISRVIEELSKVNLVQMADKLDQALDRMNMVFGQGELVDTLQQLNRISHELEESGRNLHEVLSDKNIERINQSLNNIESSTANIFRITGNQDLITALQNWNELSKHLRGFLDRMEAGSLRVEKAAALTSQRLENAMVRMENTSRDLTRTIDRLADNPNAVVRGNGAPALEDQTR
ncbi:MAG: MCE family protein [Lentisphaeria bacterium]|nr:MCE family protein [Lentisphaeria bacterium]